MAVKEVMFYANVDLLCECRLDNYEECLWICMFPIFLCIKLVLKTLWSGLGFGFTIYNIYWSSNNV